MNLKRKVAGLTLAVLVGTLSASATELSKASGEVTLDDPTGDVQAMSSSSGEHPGRDVVKLRIASDGTDLTIAATLAAEISGTFANDVIQLYVDKDNDVSTGAAATWTQKTGFEWNVELLACIEYESGGEACVGGAGNKATAYYSVAKVTDTASGQALQSVWVLPKTTIQGSVVESKVSYADLGVESGQTIRLCARESNGAYDESSYFPEVAFTLK
jgi:hypothetical protein